MGALPSVVASRVAVALLAVMLDASLFARHFSRYLEACTQQRTVTACSLPAVLMVGGVRLLSWEHRLPVACACSVLRTMAMPSVQDVACGRLSHTYVPLALVLAGCVLSAVPSLLVGVRFLAIECEVGVASGKSGNLHARWHIEDSIVGDVAL